MKMDGQDSEHLPINGLTTGTFSSVPVKETGGSIIVGGTGSTIRIGSTTVLDHHLHGTSQPLSS